MGHWLRRFTAPLGLFLESNCPLCQRSTSDIFCQDCQHRVNACQIANASPVHLEALPVIAWGVYTGALKRSIAALKYHDQPQLARPLGHGLAQVWLDSPYAATRSLVVVPIPLHAAKRQQRGFNQAELLAEAFCERTGLPMQRHGLIRVRTTDAQFSLSPEAREQNLAGAFQPSPEWLRRRPTRSVLLLDDIYTTGATAKAAIYALTQQHISVYGMVTVARAIRQG